MFALIVGTRQLRWSTCHQRLFCWLLDHVIYIKLKFTKFTQNVIKNQFSLDIRVSVNLSFFEKIGLFLALLEDSCTGNTGYKTEPQFIVTSVVSERVLKNSPIFSKNAKFMLTLMSKEKFRFYTSKMYEICLHCHLLDFSGFRMNYERCVLPILSIVETSQVNVSTWCESK
jgi:hypothetical protein